MKKLLFVLFAFMFLSLNAQEHTASLKYTLPADKLVQAKLSQWGKIKFGLLMHWGTYSQWGVVESWSLCPEDEGWTVRKGPYAKDWFSYKQAYENLQTTFNPIKFNPEKWALAAKNAGMKYMAKKQQAMMNNMMGGMGDMGGAQGQNPFADLMRQMQDMQNQQGGGQYRDSTIIDGEAREVKPDQKKIEFKDVN